MKNANWPKRFAGLAHFIPLLLAGMLVSCVQVKTEPIRIEPIYIEITINHRVQEELDDLFADIDKASQTAVYAPVANSEPQP
jgi:hypothetical protein